MRKYAFVLIALFLISNTNAQWHPDIDFNTPKPGSLPINLKINPPNGILVTFEMSHRSQIDSIPDLDSLLKNIQVMLAPVIDSLEKLKSGFRIDIRGQRIRITDNDIKGKSYRYKKDSLNEVKELDDTIRIRLTETITVGLPYRPMFITFSGGLKYIFKTPTPSYDSAIAALKDHLKGRPVKDGFKTYARYDWEKKEYHFQKKYYNKSFEPDVYVAAQYVRGYWVPSVAVGFMFLSGDYEGKRKEFKLLWDPNFYFNRNDETKRLETFRNDFVTLKYYKHDVTSAQDFDMPLNFSLGYLVGRKGDLFEKNTFKFACAGVRYKTFYIEPEFFFNDFFKNFSPSLKLNYHMD